MVVCDEDEGTVAEGSGGEGVVHGYDSRAVDVLPLLDGSNGSLVRQAIAF
jgi:hypothetical protein